jgi:hypothetical protein
MRPRVDPIATRAIKDCRASSPTGFRHRPATLLCLSITKLDRDQIDSCIADLLAEKVG